MSKKIVDIDAVLERLSQVLDCKNDTQLAEALGVGRTTVSSWRSRDSVPYSECVDVAKREGVSLDYILIGREPAQLTEAVMDDAGGDFVDKVENLNVVTQRVIDIAKSRKKQPDLMQLGVLRDLAFTARLTDEHIVILFELLENASTIYGD